MLCDTVMYSIIYVMYSTYICARSCSCVQIHATCSHTMSCMYRFFTICKYNNIHTFCTVYVCTYILYTLCIILLCFHLFCVHVMYVLICTCVLIVHGKCPRSVSLMSSSTRIHIILYPCIHLHASCPGMTAILPYQTS